MDELFTTLGGYYAGIMMLVAWFATEKLWDPLAHWVAMHRWFAGARKQLSWTRNILKWFASAVFIYPMAIWIPGAQPPLCDPPDIDLGPQCYTLFEHWVIPGLLAGLVSGGHFSAKFGKKLIDRAMKKEPEAPKAKHKIHCFNCKNEDKETGKKITIRVAAFDEPCPNCGTPDPHNPKNGNGGT